MSHDFEDIVFIFDNCETIEAELEKSSQELKEYFRQYLGFLVKSIDFNEAFSCALPLGFDISAEEVINRIKCIL